MSGSKKDVLTDYNEEEYQAQNPEATWLTRLSERIRPNMKGIIIATSVILGFLTVVLLYLRVKPKKEKKENPELVERTTKQIIFTEKVPTPKKTKEMSKEELASIKAKLPKGTKITEVVEEETVEKKTDKKKDTRGRSK